MTIFWTDEATSDLEAIFDYYISEASLQVAQTIIDGIVNAIDYLENYPESGQVESLLTNRKNTYRYLVKGNYKILYSIQPDAIYIASVFDCRQNPSKMDNI